MHSLTATVITAIILPLVSLLVIMHVHMPLSMQDHWNEIQTNLCDNVKILQHSSTAPSHWIIFKDWICHFAGDTSDLIVLHLLDEDEKGNHLESVVATLLADHKMKLLLHMFALSQIQLG